MTTFHTYGLDKSGASAIAKQLGLRRDWARVKLAEIYKLLGRFDPERLLDAAIRSNHFSEADLARLTDPAAAYPPPPPEDQEAPEAAPALDADIPASPPIADSHWPHRETKPTTTPAPDVAQVAALLAQLLATGKAGLDRGEVEDIVAPMIRRHGGEMLNAIEAKIASAVKGIPAREIIVKSERAEVKIDGLQHKDFETLIRLCAARQPDNHRLNIWLYGPPGTGKTTAAMNAAKGLDLPFYCNGALSTKYELIGFKDASGTYQRTPFRDAWENGGVYLFDEIDGSDPKAVVAFNSALANGIMAFPDGMIERHADAVMIAASNTVHGATSDFTGRMKLDAATIDRFVFLEWEIDEELERGMCPIPEWVKHVQQFRAKVASKGVRVHITPRATLYGAALLAQGLSRAVVARTVLRKGMTAEQWKILEA